MYSKVLVVNRGLILSGCIKAVRELGAKAAAAFEPFDALSPGVRLADEAHALQAPAPTKGYLDAAQVAALAERIGADAVHPGYGFLAYSDELPRQLSRRGIDWIGPHLPSGPAGTDKANLKKAAAQAGFRVIPGSDHCPDWRTLERAARALGFPVVVKSGGGYGGRGIRVARDEASLKAAYDHVVEQCRNFSLDTGDIFVERYLPDARHIEVSVLRDRHGNMQVFPEMECSVQRRFQKQLVETPSPAVTPAARRRLQENCRDLAQKLELRGFASFEFLFHEGQALFMELNGFIQLAHSATSTLTGIDLVREQIRILSGDSLPAGQQLLDPHGHALCAYINAEDPERNFEPSPGRIDDLRFPAGDGIAFHSALYTGDPVEGFYDPLVARIVAVDSTRDMALRRMDLALAQVYVGGIRTNVPLMRAVLRCAEFRKGEVSISFMSQTANRHRLLDELRTPDGEDVAAIAAALALHRDRNRIAILETARRDQPAFSVWSLTSRLLNRKKMEY